MDKAETIWRINGIMGELESIKLKSTELTADQKETIDLLVESLTVLTQEV